MFYKNVLVDMLHCFQNRGPCKDPFARWKYLCISEDRQDGDRQQCVRQEIVTRRWKRF